MKGNGKMKDFLKKVIVTVCAISASFTLITTTVSATDGFRNSPDSAVTTTTTDAPQKEEKTTESNTKTDDVTVHASTQNVPVKKYLTKWGGFFWFLLSVIVNFILSCWVGNRFYRLARRESQSSAEIRALRKDIEEKFASTIKDIDEPVIDVVNSNESYARSDEGMEMPERTSSVEINDEEREILGRWDMKREADKEATAEARNDSRRTYAPTRAMSGIQFEEDENEPVEEKNPSIRSKVDTIAKAGSKAKDFLSNIFPFDE